MHLPEVFNAPRICYLGGRIYWCRALSIEGTATVLAWLDDVIPGRSERTSPPELGSEASQAALGSQGGKWLLTWLALREHGLSYEQAAELPIAEIEYARLLTVLFAIRRTAQRDPMSEGRDIAETWCAAGVAELASQIGIEAVGRLSRDQFEWMMSGGTVDPHADPDAGAYQRAVAEWQKNHDAYQAKQAAESMEVINGPST